MITVYIYLITTMADWELGHVTAELNSKRFFMQDAPAVCVKTVALTKEPVKTMGGLTIIPDCTIEEIEVNEKSVLILPGADTWGEEKNAKIIAKAAELLEAKGCVCATGGLLFAKKIIEHIGVFSTATLEEWYAYFSTGEASHFFALMQSVNKQN